MESRITGFTVTETRYVRSSKIGADEGSGPSLADTFCSSCAQNKVLKKNPAMGSALVARECHHVRHS